MAARSSRNQFLASRGRDAIRKLEFCKECVSGLGPVRTRQRCLLTDSTMPSANFRGAKLCGAGLAGIDWPQADLRDCDLTHATFHLGSTRSGLVGSTIPSEGSKTGF